MEQDFTPSTYTIVLVLRRTTRDITPKPGICDISQLNKTITINTQFGKYLPKNANEACARP